MNEKKVSYKMLMDVVEQIKNESFDWTTKTFPDLDLNMEVLEFIQLIQQNNSIVNNQYGFSEIVSNWYKKHSKNEIDKKYVYFKNKLDVLLNSETYKATKRTALYLKGESHDNHTPYINVLLFDIEKEKSFVACMDKKRFITFMNENSNKRPFISIRTILNDYTFKKDALVSADIEY